MLKVGIDSMSFYIPEQRLSIADLIQYRTKLSEEIGKILHDSCITTKQEFLRLNTRWQDSVTLATQSALSLLTHTKDISTSLIRYLISATETSIDASKPISAYILGILQKANIPLHKQLVNYQVQHACAGGTIAMLQVAASIMANKRESQALLSMTDIARYEAETSAEVTQGAGSVSMLISQSPRLLEIDIDSVGYSSEDVDDFFRPHDSKTAKVKGRYSMSCYIESSYTSMLDLAEQQGKTILELIEDTDYIVLHSPFATMGEIAIGNILRKKLKLSKEDATRIIEEKKIPLSSEIVKHIGNTYTSAAYFPLAYLLQEEYTRISKDICGKKILFLSYGAGNTAIALTATVADRATEVIETWNLNQQLQEYQDMSVEEYEKWITQEHSPTSENLDITTKRGDPSIFLKEIREDSYRIYDIYKPL